MSNLKDTFIESAMPYVEEIKSMISKNKDLVIDHVHLNQLYGGMRGVMSLTCETSKVDPDHGIRLRGYSIPDVIQNMSALDGSSSLPSSEGIFLLLLLGRMPTKVEIQQLRDEWQQRSHVPAYIYKVIDLLPDTANPMEQFTTALAALQSESKFSKAYRTLAKKDYWSYVYEDALDLIAKLPHIAAYIYNKIERHDAIIDSHPNLDWAGNMAHLLGDEDTRNDSILKDFFRLYLFLHSDHEGGNGSAFVGHVVGSTLANPYAAFTGSMTSLSGPLHGAATQTVFYWIKEMVHHYHDRVPTHEEIEQYINHTLESGRVIPGYGHAVLRQTDPRFVTLMDFANKNNLHGVYLDTVQATYQVAPIVLQHIGKIKNPYPNVDSISGSLLNKMGFQDPNFYTVLFGVSRSLGVMANQIWDRVMMIPLFRPKSITSKYVKDILIPSILGK